jgi:ADP-ribose pyrophosphatase YjhB (NUDIX family)
MNVIEAIHVLDSYIDDPRVGLPEDLFYFISRVTPLVNVDLLVKNEKGEFLLTWREDGRWPPSWHIPGGIIRYQEKIEDRIKKVALKELKSTVEFKKDMIDFNEIIIPSRKVRGHFMSLLFECALTGPLNQEQKYMNGRPVPGQWAWFSSPPEDFIPVHGYIYHKHLNAGEQVFCPEESKFEIILNHY